MRRRLLASVAWLVLAGCGPDAALTDEGNGASMVNGVRRLMATGKVVGCREADVVSTRPGRIMHFEHEEGDEVDAGTPVVQLEDFDLHARVEEAAARAKEAAGTIERIRLLRAAGIVSLSELDHAEASYRTSAAALERARVNLAYATVRAPFRGTVLQKFKEVGEGVTVVGPPEPLFRIADLSQMKVIAEVPERDIGALRADEPAVVTSDAYPDSHFPATISRIGLAVGRKKVRSDDPRARIDEKVVEVELKLAADTRLRSGMTVDVAFGRPGTTVLATPERGAP